MASMLSDLPNARKFQSHLEIAGVTPCQAPTQNHIVEAKKAISVALDKRGSSY